ncbi:MAG TPA: hypothetical protein VGE13_01910 [Candidatus Saccharimonadales bacterium]
MRRRLQQAKGFTLVELMLAMSFLVILLLMITLLILQVTMIYNKGLTLREVNESGQLISSEIQRRLSTAPTETVGSVSNVVQDSRTTDRLCVDGIVYAWTLADKRNADNTKNVGFAKFNGSKKDYCDQSPAGGGGMSPPTGVWPASNKITNLIDTQDQSLVIRKFSFHSIGGTDTENGIDGDKTQALYRVTFVIGTNTSDLIDSNDTCLPPASAKQEFCAVNEFAFIVRSGDGGEE